MRPARSLFVLVALLAACNHESTLETSALLADASFAIRTHADSYRLIHADGVYKGKIDFTYTNRTDETTYLMTCHVPTPPAIERKVGDQWVTAYAPASLACLGPAIAVEPAGSYEYTLHITAYEPGSNIYPKWKTPIAGTYRIVWYPYTASDPAHGVALPLSERTSNAFTITG